MRALLGLFGVLAVVLALVAHAHAADLPVVFDDASDQARYESLLEELRCLVCQNQSLADSHAELAQDMRDEVHRMISSGASDGAITEFLVARYGDFVLYRPPVKRTTWLLWGGPFLLLVLAAAVVIRLSRRPRTAPQPLSDAERARLDALIDDEPAERP